MIRSLLTASIRFRLLMLAIAGGLLVLGATQLPKMHSDVLPETSATVVEVQTEAQGLSGPEVESLVTVPMEQNLLDGIMGVTSVTSDSIPGLSAIDLHFQPGFDPLHARQLVQERLTQAFALPNVSKPPVMLQPVSSTSRVMMIGLTSRRLSPIELSVLARWTVVPRLLGLPGVANVSTFGQADRQLQVLVDPKRLAAKGVTLGQIIETAGNSQLVSPLSYLQASTPGTGGFLEGANQRISIRHLLPFGTPRDLGQVPVAGVTGPPLPLHAVANIVEGHQPQIGQGLVHGMPGLVLVVEKLPSASVTGVTREVDRALAELRPGLQGVTIDASAFRPATYVHSSLHTWALGSIIAIVLVALAFGALFMRAWAALVGLTSVLLSMVVALLVLDALGYTFNALVALGLLTSLGVVVDDAITSTHALLSRGTARRHRRPSQLFDMYAGMRGSLAYAALALLLCVTPVFVASGPTARFVHPIVLAYGLAVMASMGVALTLTPALALLVAPARAGSPRRRSFSVALLRSYRRGLRRAMRAPVEVPLLACIAGVVAIAVLPWLGSPKRPNFNDRSVVVHWSAPAGTSLPEMNRITARASRELLTLPGVADVGANVGRALTSDQVVNANTGEIWVSIKRDADYGRALSAIRGVVQGTPGVQATVSTYEADSMAGILGTSTHLVTARIYGNDYGQLARLAAKLTAQMSLTPGLAHPRTELPSQQPTIELKVDVAKAERAGVKPGDVRRQAATLLSGLTVGNFFEQQKVFDVVVWGEPAVRSSLASVRNLLLDTEGGGHVRLGDIASIVVRPDPVDIKHEGISRYVDVTAGVRGRSLSSARTAVAALLRRIQYPLEYHAELLGGPTDPSTSHAAFVSYALAALIGIFLLVQAALGSWRLAAIVCLLLPVALSGGVIVAVGSGNLGELGTLAGLLAVLGIALRHAILLTARMRRLQEHERGALSAEQIVRAGSDRLLPTLASNVTIWLAFAPFASMGALAGGELLHLAAAVVLGGLCSETLLILFLLPVACHKLAPEPRASVTSQPPEVALPVPTS